MRVSRVLPGLLLGLLLPPSVSVAADLANGASINRRCAVCHALYGQGAPGRLSPRLAGLPEWYLVKATQDYQSGARKNPLMVSVAHLDALSDADIGDVSAYLARLDIGADPAYDIRLRRGDAARGRARFKHDCKTCHGKDGYGKRKKKAPPLAGQHPGYLFASIKAFYRKDRQHDNDPIDDTFDDIADAGAWDILAYTATLDDAHIRPNQRFDETDQTLSASPTNEDAGADRPPSTKPGTDPAIGFQLTGMDQTVISRALPPGISNAEVVQAMLAKAKAIGVPYLPDPETLPAATDSGQASITVLEFCRPRHIATLIDASPLLANYGPCRITLVRDSRQRGWLSMVNLDMLIDGRQLPPAAQRIAILVNQDLLAIIAAGADRGHR